MKKIYVAYLLLFVSFIVTAQSKSAKTILDKTIETMKENSVNSKMVDWKVVTEEAYKLASNSKEPEELGESIRFLFRSLDDFHGSFRYKDSVFRWVKEKVEIPDIYKTEFAKKGNKFFTKSLGDIGYLRIPTTLQDIAKERSRALQDSLCKLLTLNPKGLIFDLRLNGGGHIMSMAMGISSILEYGVVSPGDEIRKDGYYRKSETGYDNIHPFTQTCERNHLDIPIVVLIGPMTGSSAEMLAIILKNRPNTILIGEPTAGWVTGVWGKRISRDAHLNLSIGYMTDANNQVYKTKIQPSILIQDGDDFTNLENDAKVKRALEYLKGLK